MNLNVYVGTALLDVYAKSGLIKDASSVFESLPERSDVTWSSMVAGYVQNELYEEALVLFHRAKSIGLEQNHFTVSFAICACAGLAALIEGKQLPALLSKTGFGLNVFVVSSLVDMYAKCGSIREAYSVFQGMNERNIVLWNAMISGFARHACSLEVMVLFEKMQQIGRSGLILEAYDLIQKIPFGATVSMWGSLLASCRIHGNIDLAEVATKHLSEIEPNNAGNHILLSNVYAANNKWGEVARRREILKESELKKDIGKSWIEIKDKVHSFMVG
ncbi:hypothetical protein C1H46_022210 [Malus baccata]|uniref:Pentatricopeptide repeat-containing protein n=1 Tax=Malus baccata TaxID=106549 RepID=A0A540M0G5_MALBA|nr:hypothetical protein C1H46_022210 [Malus baccata]